MFGLFGSFTPTDDAEGGAVGVKNGNEAPDDVEAAAGPRVATDQQSAAGERAAEEQPERPSQRQGRSANNSLDAALPRPPPGGTPEVPRIAFGEHQISKAPTRDQGDLQKFTHKQHVFRM